MKVQPGFIARWGNRLLRGNEVTRWGVIFRSYTNNASSDSEATAYPKFREDEMAVLTDNPASVPMLETILRCPMYPSEWKDISKSDREFLWDIKCVYDLKKLPSVTKILQSTQPPINQIILAKWKRKMTEELGEEGFSKHMLKISGEGTTFHQSIENFLNNKHVEIKNTGQWKSISNVLEKVSGVHMTESMVTHPMLSYLGKVDCVAMYENTLCVIDWKLSAKKRDTLKKCYDDPYQAAAYVGAINATSSNKISNAVIVKGYRDGTPADAHFLNKMVLEFYWEGWIRRLARYHVRTFNSMQKTDGQRKYIDTIS